MKSERVSPTVFICKGQGCKNLQTYYGERAEIICNGCGRTFDAKGKEIKDRPRVVNVGVNYKVSLYESGDGSMAVSVFDKSFGSMFHLNETEARSFKKFLNDAVK